MIYSSNFLGVSQCSSLSDENSDPVPVDKPTKRADEPDNSSVKATDEWGEEAEPKPESSKVVELKRCLVDCVYGTELGFRARLEESVEILELVNQLEALNPTLALNKYMGFSELLPLLAVGSTPLLKANKITQSINTSNLTIVNSTTLSSPFSTSSFSASVSFDVRSPSRIQAYLLKENVFFFFDFFEILDNCFYLAWLLRSCFLASWSQRLQIKIKLVRQFFLLTNLTRDSDVDTLEAVL
ncbi:hypothetical protein UlMin_016985 [Ulmus minor]